MKDPLNEGDFNLNQSKGLHEMSSEDVTNISGDGEKTLTETLPYDNPLLSGSSGIKPEPEDRKPELKTEDDFIMGTVKDVHWNVNRDYDLEENMEHFKYFEEQQNVDMVKKELEYDDGRLFIIMEIGVSLYLPLWW